ncbi:MAG: bifunctional ornithine acetyltransferase/N-acetylglutamate synthase, partial [Oscillospiraceae bacterium]|nr:bifunctional ornithine acetyltransferase/N-acetylglutamate synthase [Oscillospiraceae bacterium]
MEQIEGGVTAPQGFSTAGIHCGVKATEDPEKKDLALIVSQRECTAAAVYTRNRVRAAPLYVTQENLQNGRAWGVVANSGNANACAPKSMENARAMCRLAAAATGRAAEDFVVASTGVIGQELNLAAIARGIPQAAAALSPEGSDSAAHAIMTTDTYKKEFALAAEIGGQQVRIGAIAKGSGMIHPNMGTMLCFITTDCQISAPCLRQALEWVVERTFNRVTVDGDTSTNDTCAVLANGMAGNPPIQGPGPEYDAFLQALYALCRSVARAIAADGEGASRLLTCAGRDAADAGTAAPRGPPLVGSWRAR